MFLEWHDWRYLTLLCRDRPKMGDYMTDKILLIESPKNGPFYGLIWKPVGCWHQNCHGQAGSFSKNRPKMGDSMKMLPMAHNPSEEFWFS
jgi:hypothetical protein